MNDEIMNKEQQEKQTIDFEIPQIILLGIGHHVCLGSYLCILSAKGLSLRGDAGAGVVYNPNK